MTTNSCSAGAFATAKGFYREKIVGEGCGKGPGAPRSRVRPPGACPPMRSPGPPGAPGLDSFSPRPPSVPLSHPVTLRPRPDEPVPFSHPVTHSRASH